MIHLQREELTEQIGKLNIKITKANKELDELELKYKKKKLEIRKYKNESVGLQLELQELELENWKEIQEEQKIKRIQKETRKYIKTSVPAGIWQTAYGTASSGLCRASASSS